MSWVLYLHGNRKARLGSIGMLMCIDTSVDMCVGICTDMCVNICIDMYVEMFSMQQDHRREDGVSMSMV